MKSKSILQETFKLKKETEETKLSVVLHATPCKGREILKWEMYGETLLCCFSFFRQRKHFLPWGVLCLETLLLFQVQG